MITKNLKHKCRSFIIASILAVSLSGCAVIDFLSEDDEIPLEGERVSILELQQTLKAEQPAEINPEEFGLPEQWRNEYWPQVGGYPNHAMQNLALTETQPKLAWTAKIGQGASEEIPLTATPIIVNGRAYTIDANSKLSAFRIEDGKKIWHSDVSNPEEDDPVIGGGIAYSRGKIYITNGYNEVLAVKPEDGAVLWRTALPSPSRAAPTIMEERVFISTLDSRLITLDAATGQILWEYSGLNESTSLVGAAAPAASRGFVIPAFASGEIFALHVENGSVAWGENLSSFRHAGGLSALSDIRGLPVIDKGTVYAVSFGGRMIAINERSGKRIWERQIGSAETIWVAGNHLYVLSNENEMLAIERKKGTIIWVRQLPRYADPEDRDEPLFWTGPVVAGDRVITAGSDGRILEMNAMTGEPIRSWTTGNPIRLPLTVAGKTLYILSENGTLMAYR